VTAERGPADQDEPVAAGPPAGGATVRCPFCGSERTRLESPFGSTLGFALYWCEGCRTAFEYLKWEDEPAR
jgi:DNA-directed RNA polymerase subunit RPC12/RpoP